MTPSESQAYYIMFSWSWYSSDVFSLFDLLDENDARLTLRGGLAMLPFSGELSLLLSNRKAERVRFLLVVSAGLDDRSVVISFASCGSSAAPSIGGAVVVVSRIVLKKSRAAPGSLISTITLLSLVA